MPAQTRKLHQCGIEIIRKHPWLCQDQGEKQASSNSLRFPLQKRHDATSKQSSSMWPLHSWNQRNRIAQKHRPGRDMQDARCMID